MQRSDTFVSITIAPNAPAAEPPCSSLRRTGSFRLAIRKAPLSGRLLPVTSAHPLATGPWNAAWRSQLPVPLCLPAGDLASAGGRLICVLSSGVLSTPLPATRQPRQLPLPGGFAVLPHRGTRHRLYLPLPLGCDLFRCPPVCVFAETRITYTLVLQHFPVPSPVTGVPGFIAPIRGLAVAICYLRCTTCSLLISFFFGRLFRSARLQLLYLSRSRPGRLPSLLCVEAALRHRCLCAFSISPRRRLRAYASASLYFRTLLDSRPAIVPCVLPPPVFAAFASPSRSRPRPLALSRAPFRSGFPSVWPLLGGFIFAT